MKERLRDSIPQKTHARRMNGDGSDIALRKIEVHTEVTHSYSAIFHGKIGLDVPKQCSRMTFNFESMNFILEE